jgi:hypothetical protein
MTKFLKPKRMAGDKLSNDVPMLSHDTHNFSGFDIFSKNDNNKFQRKGQK